MADHIDDFLDQHLPGFTPEEREQFRNQYAPPPPADYSQFFKQGAAPAASPSDGSFEDWQDSGGAGAVRQSTPWDDARAESASRAPQDASSPPPGKAYTPGVGDAISTGLASVAQKSGIVPEVAPEKYDDNARYNNFRAGVGEIGPPQAPIALEPEDQWDHSGAPGTGPLRMVDPGGWRPHSRSTQQGLQLPATIAATGRADASHREAAAAERDAGKAQAIRETAFLEQHEKAQESRALQLQAQAQDRKRRYDAEMSKLGQLTDVARADKIDPGSIFTKHGTAGAFMASIAYTLGAVGGALTHTENPVIGVIRDEIQSQKDNASLNRQKIEDQKGILGQLTRTFGDASIAEDAAWTAYLEKAKTTMQRIVAGSQDQWIQAKYQNALAGIDDELARRIGSIEEKTQNHVMQQDVFAPPTYAGGGAKPENADPLFVPTGPQGQGFKARSEKEAQAARGVMTAKQQLVPKIERLKQLRAQSNVAERFAARSGTYESPTMAEIKSLQNEVVLGLRDLSTSSPGAMDKGMQEIASGISGDWLSVQGHPEAAGDNLVRSINGQADALMRGQGAQSQKQSLHIDQKGNVVTGLRGQPKFANPKSDAKPKTFKGAE